MLGLVSLGVVGRLVEDSEEGGNNELLLVDSSLIVADCSEFNGISKFNILLEKSQKIYLEKIELKQDRN